MRDQRAGKIIKTAFPFLKNLHGDHIHYSVMYVMVELLDGHLVGYQGVVRAEDNFNDPHERKALADQVHREGTMLSSRQAQAVFNFDLDRYLQPNMHTRYRKEAGIPHISQGQYRR
jgi:hypothetical protein